MLNKWKVLPLVAVFLLLSSSAFADELFSLKGGINYSALKDLLPGLSMVLGRKLIWREI